ncbi:MAG: M81 family metallopeptidase [Rhodospirillaceae bacterium]|jgi:microcystin degradation protein MlrC|nr:M81 family metallopeptidase [Rhodospirillaceae bacterium]MBT5899113.1 M81 family metallopeptidase [Rhodospirillaceae bacterium]MBT6426177.1 M81 family metallopeptidase [Rhodospirillaceae bacterium]MBT7757619.1 M81 family metallopeptidase [Rhodospirillaceae bacterium]
MTRLAIGGLVHETVSFLPEETTLADFERRAVRSDGIAPAFAGSNTVFGGFLKVCEDNGVAVEGLLCAECAPSGPVSREAFKALTDELVSRATLWRDETDGLLLHLHGAMVSRGELDPEHALLARLRKALGDDYPIAVAMDLHGNVGAEKAALADILCGFRHSPHTDMAETGERTAKLLLGRLAGNIKPVHALARPGLVLPSIFTATAVSPLKEIMDDVRAAADQPGILDVTLFTGFAYADVPEIGATVVAIADGDEALAIRTAERLSSRLVEAREELYQAAPLYEPYAALDKAAELLTDGCRPVVLLEHADRGNDSTHLLEAMLARDVGRVAIPYLHDPIAAKAADSAGLGAQLMTTLGGKSSEMAGPPLLFSGFVKFTGPLRYRITGPYRTGEEVDLGLSAVIDNGRIAVIVTTHSVSAVDTDPFTQCGLDIEEFDIIALRSKTHFRAAYEPIAGAILIVETPDWGPADLIGLPYRNVPPGVYPITMYDGGDDGEEDGGNDSGGDGTENGV